MMIAASACRVASEPSTLVITTCGAPQRSRTWFMAPSVSIVSPDWVTATTSVDGPNSGARKRNSEALSKSAGMPAICSIHQRPIIAACSDVPMPMTRTRSIPRSVDSGRSKSSARALGGSRRARPRIVSESARGCSWISLSMKCRYGPLAMATGSRSTWTGVGSYGACSPRRMVTDSESTTAMSPSSR